MAFIASFPPTAMAIRMYPACAIDEYASILLILVWTMAITVPTAMVSMEMTMRIVVQ